MLIYVGLFFPFPSILLCLPLPPFAFPSLSRPFPLFPSLSLSLPFPPFAFASFPPFPFPSPSLQESARRLCCQICHHVALDPRRIDSEACVCSAGLVYCATCLLNRTQKPSGPGGGSGGSGPNGPSATPNANAASVRTAGECEVRAEEAESVTFQRTRFGSMPWNLLSLASSLFSSGFLSLCEMRDGKKQKPDDVSGVGSVSQLDLRARHRSRLFGA